MHTDVNIKSSLIHWAIIISFEFLSKKIIIIKSKVQIMLTTLDIIFRKMNIAIDWNWEYKAIAWSFRVNTHMMNIIDVMNVMISQNTPNFCFSLFDSCLKYSSKFIISSSFYSFYFYSFIPSSSSFYLLFYSFFTSSSTFC